MEELRNIYKKRFFARRNSMNWRSPIMAKAIEEVFHPSSVVDVGCATGDILAALADNYGCYIHGIEGSDQVLEYIEIKREQLTIADLRSQLTLTIDGMADRCEPIHFDLCMSLEVAEHIEPEYAEQYVDNLCSLSDRVLITAAPPGQGGHHHVNCQFPEYWEVMMAGRGYTRFSWMENDFKKLIEPWKHKKGIKAYYDNVLYFHRLKEDEYYLRKTEWWSEMLNQS